MSSSRPFLIFMTINAEQAQHHQSKTVMQPFLVLVLVLLGVMLLVFLFGTLVGLLLLGRLSRYEAESRVASQSLVQPEPVSFTELPTNTPTATATATQSPTSTSTSTATPTATIHSTPIIIVVTSTPEPVLLKTPVYNEVTPLPQRVIVNLPGSSLGNGSHQIPIMDNINGLLHFKNFIQQWGDNAGAAFQIPANIKCFNIEPHTSSYAYILDKNNLWYGDTKGWRITLVTDLQVPDYPNCLASPNNNGWAGEILVDGRRAVLAHLNPNTENVSKKQVVFSNPYGNYFLQAYDEAANIVLVDDNGVAVAFTQAGLGAVPLENVVSCQRQQWTIPHFQIDC